MHNCGTNYQTTPMHTPEQAKDLWCPMVRGVRWEADSYRPGIDDPTTAVGGCNSGGAAARSPLGCRCIADRCAMWRWEPMTESVPTVTLGAGNQQARTFGMQTVRTHGYCGIAGRPEVN